MKLSIVFLSVAAVFLAGCSRPVKETVIERPVYVTTPPPPTTVITPSASPAPPTTVITPSASAGATSAGCAYASQNYSHGALSCQDRTEFKCDAGIWRRTFAAC
jgi:hypothetical protein